ncbi:hypothetical protein SAMN02745126_03293 [Enhydrobacter aerosaccus]|uniref:Uncharacterized protein n=1 Tax=Enhydrobacter aerosaccus TaxID=225324 RepID=A0A1T4QLF1_9HYPH|nr:hypothetical protein [Enhydrobacter aerosaccus]SKA04457.1 hypothetical protein SAMN02745126_03293 [Enhydrobacter aerosaccus]
MGALGHFLEREGIPTVGISLVREHTETVRPPRALWVTFDLGRPLGIPDDPPFQRRVVKAALDLLARTDGPIIVDYPEFVTEEADFTGWACPINLAPTEVDTLAAEIDRLAAWYDRASATNGRTTVGVSGLDMPAAGMLVTQALDGELPAAQALKEAVDDLKAYYLEAASAFPDPGTAKTRKEWFWSETRLAAALLALQPKLAASSDPQHRILGNLTLIPATERHRVDRS